MKEIFPGLYQMPLTLSGFDPGSVNLYLIKTSNGLAAIDTGWDMPEALQSMQSQLGEIGSSISDIHTAILTHFHIDHLGLVPRLRQSQNIKVYLHAKELAMMKIRYTGTDNFLPMTDKFLQTHGFPPEELTPPEFQLPFPDKMDSIKPDVLLQGGEELSVGDYSFKVINTPGHTPGHIALFEAKHRFLISGDMLLPTIATNAAFHVQHIDYPLQKYLESLKALRNLDFGTVLPGHEYVFNNPHQRIDELIKNHEKKAAVIIKAFNNCQTRTAYQISRTLARSARTGISKWDEMTGWEKRFAVLQTIAHLESLEYTHKLETSEVAGIHFFKAFSD
jgi:glyoxylase-like metal-dependent hydrolase (beta-lactamase superfamily II)